MLERLKPYFSMNQVTHPENLLCLCGTFSSPPSLSFHSPHTPHLESFAGVDVRVTVKDIMSKRYVNI